MEIPYPITTKEIRTPKTQLLSERLKTSVLPHQKLYTILTLLNSPVYDTTSTKWPLVTCTWVVYLTRDMTGVTCPATVETLLW